MTIKNGGPERHTKPYDYTQPTSRTPALEKGLTTLLCVWLLSLPFQRFSVVGTFSVDNLMAPLLCLVALAPPSARQTTISRARMSTLSWITALFLVYGLAKISIPRDPALFWTECWFMLRSALYFFAPLLVIRSMATLHLALGSIVITTSVAAISSILAALNIVALPEARFAESRIGIEWLPKSIGLFSSYGDLAMLFGLTASLLVSHGRRDLAFGLGKPIAKAAIWLALLAGLLGTQSRNVALATIAAVGTWTTVHWYRKRTARGKSTTPAILSAVALFLIAGGLSWFYSEELTGLISGLGGERAMRNAVWRLDTYTYALDLIAREPVLGISPEVHKANALLVDHIHNMWLAILLDGGIVAFLGMAGLLVLAIKGGMAPAKTLTQPDKPAMTLAATAGLLAATQFYGGESDVFYTLMGILLSFNWVRHDARQPS